MLLLRKTTGYLGVRLTLRAEEIIIKTIELLFIFSLIPASILQANDSRMVSFGNTQMVDGKNTSIAIEHEKITITLHRESFEVAVRYQFRNEGDESVVTVGFPISASVQGYDLKNVKIDGFESKFNGRKIDEFGEKTEQTEKGSYFHVKKWYLRKLTFPGNADSSSEVNYRSTYSFAGFSRFAEYILGSAYNWKGTIRKLEVDLKVDKGLIITDWKIAAFHKGNLPNSLTATSDGFRFTVEDYAVAPEDVIRFGTSNYSPPKEYSNEFGTFAQGWVWDREYIFDKNDDEVILLTSDQIQLFINFFYAFRGYIFKDPDLRKFFSVSGSIFGDDFDTKYSPNPNFTEKMFNKVERANVDYLRKLKERLYRK